MASWQVFENRYDFLCEYARIHASLHDSELNEMIEYSLCHNPLFHFEDELEWSEREASLCTSVHSKEYTRIQVRHRSFEFGTHDVIRFLLPRVLLERSNIFVQ